MDITLRTPLCFTEIGKKDNQEDRLYPANGAGASNRTFVLCDGMGGHERGEVAAEIVSSTIGRALDRLSSPEASQAEFDKALALSYKALDNQLADDSARKPGTTLTCLRFGDNGVLAAHIGDSRIYQVRPGVGIMYRTSDHSLVNELVRAGELTEAEARVHPRRNVITRAMMPGAKNPAKADTVLISDVRAGDYFFMCCDGILERLLESSLITILSDSSKTDEAKMGAIKKICDQGTRDNYTAWLIPVAEVSGNDTPEGVPVITLSDARKNEAVPEVKVVSHGNSAPQQTSGGNRSMLQIILALAVGVIAALVVYIGCGRDSEEEDTEKAIEKTEQTGTQVNTVKPEREQKASKTVKAKKEQNKPDAGKDEGAEKPQPEKTPAATEQQTNHAATAAAAAAGRNTKPETNPDEQPVTEPATEPAPKTPVPDNEPLAE